MIISVVGSGGKSTYIKKLVNANKGEFQKILVTTSTKMSKDQLDCYDELIVGHNLPDVVENKVYALCLKIKNGKCYSIDEEYFNKIADKFDLIIIEADGSKQKLFKLYNRHHEPVIFKKTTDVVGIVNLNVLNCLISEENTFNYEFTTEKVYTLDIIENWITREDGLFKNATNMRKHLYYIESEKRK